VCVYHHHPARITINSGASGNVIRLSDVKRLGAETHSQLIKQMDHPS